MLRAASITIVFALSGPGSAADFGVGKPDLRSISALAFGPEGVLFVGDGKGGAVFAIDVGSPTRSSPPPCSA